MWTAAGLGFTLVFAAASGPTAGGEYLAGYVIERCLSLDNVFVFGVVLGGFAVPEALRRWAVGWAIGAALALRGVFILAGSAMLDAAEWTAYLRAIALAAKTMAGSRVTAKIDGMESATNATSVAASTRRTARSGVAWSRPWWRSASRRPWNSGEMGITRRRLRMSRLWPGSAEPGAERASRTPARIRNAANR